MSNIFQSRFHSRAGSLLEASRVFAQFSVENVCKAGNTLLWDLLQDETIVYNFLLGLLLRVINLMLQIGTTW